MPIKSVKMKISKNKKMRFFLISQGSLNPKIRFLGQNVCSVAWLQTDRQTHRQTDRHTDRHESEYRGHPYRVSGIFPSTYHQGSVQYGRELGLWTFTSRGLIHKCLHSRVVDFFLHYIRDEPSCIGMPMSKDRT